MSGKFGLNHNVITQLANVFAQYAKIDKVILYGSRAMGNFKNGSDIDLSIFSPSMDLAELLKIENEIDDLLLPYKVDLSLYHHIDNRDMVEHIQRVGVLFYEK